MKRKTFAFLAYPDCSIWGLIGAYEIVQKTMKYIQTYPDRYDVNFMIEPILVSATKDLRVPGSYGTSVEANLTIRDMQKPDVIVVPGFDFGMDEILDQNKDAVEWLREQYLIGSEVATICTGACMLAETGLLNKKKATTHWGYEHRFKKRFPEVEVEINKMILDENGYYMSGGATTFQNLMIYLIEKYMSKQLSVDMAKMLLVDIHKMNQNEYAIFSGQKDHDDEPILRIQQEMEQNMKEFTPIEKLAEQIAMSKRTFLRRFKAATGNTPFVYMQRIKVEAAKKLLESTERQVVEIAFETGYEDITAFRKNFKKYTGLTPQVYRKKYAMVL